MKIGVVAPARGITRELATRVAGLAALTLPQVDLAFHEQCFAGLGHFAGDDATRAAAFLEVANDPATQAMWFARGGYGADRIVDTVMAGLGPAAAAKRYLGYSDLGFLLGALYARRIGRVAHGPMAGDLGATGRGDAAVVRALGWLAGAAGEIEPGLAGRPAAAFNLSILTALIGTPWLPDLTDHVVLIEEVGEPLYRIDRMLFTLAHAAQLKGIAGLRLGGVTDIQPNDPPWSGGDAEALVRHWAGVMGVPYLGRAAVEHGRDNHVVPFGVA